MAHLANTKHASAAPRTHLGLAELGLIDWIGSQTADLIKGFDEESRQSLAIILILWVSALSSSYVPCTAPHPAARGATPTHACVVSSYLASIC